jgi:hypothetical protein
MFIRGNKLHFGFDQPGAVEPPLRVPWIKVCVLCERNPAICRRCEHSQERGRVQLGKGTVVSARALACLFLSYVIGQVERYLVRRFPDEVLHVQWNVGCPIDHMDSFKAMASYETMVYLAWEERAKTSNPMNLYEVSNIESRLQGLQLPQDSDRAIHVRPETHAGVMAFLQSPHAEEKTYVIVDVGAGTTEVSMFIHGRNHSEQGKPFVSNYLGDGTFPIGGGDIDCELARIWSVSVDNARKKKESGNGIPTRLQSAETVFKSYRSVCARVVQRRMLISPHDMVFDLFLFGGGSRVSAVRSALHQALPAPWRLNRLEVVKPPRNLRRFGGLDGNFDLLALACGLASTVLDWARINPPSTTPPMTLTKPTPRKARPDRDELYPK